MYARLKITEVTTRDLSIEERCMLGVVYSNCYGGCIDEDCRKAAKDRLAEIGFVQYVDRQKTRGLFRTSERPATEIETIAWHCTQIKKECDMIGVGECAKCPKHLSKIAGCIASSDYVKSKAILDGKTISVEYCEE
jgi:hypothetical protein